MKLLSTLAVLVLIASSATAAAAETSDSDIIAAFYDCPEVIAVQDGWGPNTERGSAFIVFREGHCGAVGCGSTVLVAQEYAYTGTNPWRRHLLAQVHISARREITGVQLVRLTPVGAAADFR